MEPKRNNSVFDRIASAFKMSSRAYREAAYLSQSVSMQDLERRQREVDAGKFRSY